MKHCYLFCGMLAASAALQAQITITSSDFGNIGDQFFVGQDPNPTVTPGNSGANQTWNFTGLVTSSLDTIYFLDPATVPAAASVSGVNLVTESNEGYFFLERNNSGVYTRGVASTFNGAPVLAEYSPAQDLLPFPSTLGDNFSSTSSFSTTVFLGLDTNALGCQIQLDSIRLNRQSTLTTNFDAEGTVQLPLENIQALRAYSVDASTDSIFIYAPNAVSCPPFINIPQGWSLMPDFLAQSIGLPGGSYTQNTEVYTWYANNENFGVVAMRMDAQGGVESVLFKSDASQVSIDQVSETSLNIFPNPVEGGSLVIEGAESGDEVLLMDMAGRVVARQTPANGQVSVEGLSSGIYQLRLMRQQRLVGQQKIVVQQ